MDQSNRTETLLQELVISGQIDVQIIADRLGVSPATIRRDLRDLEAAGHLQRTRGGAVVSSSVVYEPSFAEKMNANVEAKRRIAVAAAGLVKEGESVALNSGSTTTHIARALRHKNGISIVTNAINIAMELANADGLRVILTGGELRGVSLALVGARAEAGLEGTFVHKALIGAQGISPEVGATTPNEGEALATRALIRSAKETIVVADSSKLGAITLSLIAGPHQIHQLITDSGASRDIIQRLRKAGIKVALV